MLVTASTPPSSSGDPPRKRAPSSGVWKELGYPTKTALEQAVRSIVNSATLKQALPKEQRDFLISLLKHHHEWDIKKGSGISHLEIRINVNATGSTRGIWIVRTDGSEIDISWRVPLSPAGKTTHLENLNAAAREAIQDQMHEAHETLPCECCDLCGQPMKRFDKLHADHSHPSFKDIFEDFFGGSEHTINVSNVGITTHIVDPEIRQAWQNHHAASAKLRLVHKKCNLKRSKH